MANVKTLTINGVNFTLLKGEAQKKALSREWDRACVRGYTSLWDVYGSWSRRKQLAYDDCLYINNKVNGGIMYISGANRCFFSLIYVVDYNGKTYVVKETHANRLITEYVE